MGTKTLQKNQIALIGALFLLSSFISETSKAATTMWQQNSVWMFAFQSEYPNWIHDTCIERWSVDGDTVINGQTYHNLYRDYYYIDSAPVKGLWSYSDTPIATGNVISIREDAGKIYAIKSQYLNFLKTLYPEENDFYIASAETEDEMLLYDFTLNVGDSYPCAEAAKVVEISQITTHDQILRKVLKLSNGLIIIEGVGCVNSIGTLVIYQNTSLTDEEKLVDELTVHTTARLVSFGISKETGEYECVYDGELDYQIITRISDAIPNSNVPSWHTLSGHRLSSPPTRKGVYIRDGRKVVVK